MNRGYAVSGVLYTILVLFMALLLSFLYSMQNKKNILDKLKAEVVEAFYCNGIDNIEDLTGATVIATTVESNDDNFLITIPKEGHYDTSSKLSVPINEINSIVQNIKETISNTVTVGDGTYDTKTISFNKSYTSIPNVTISFPNPNSLMFATIYDITTSECKVRVYNAGTTVASLTYEIVVY